MKKKYFNKIFIVARDYQQFIYYTHKNPLFIYLDKPEKVYGMDNFVVMFVGEYYKNPLFIEIEDVINTRRNVLIID